MKILIRTMTAADLPQVFKVRAATVENAISIQQLASYGITPESMTQALLKNTRGWVCEIEQTIVGFCMGDSDTAEMRVLAVLPAHEGLGIAKGLMQQVQQWLLNLGHDQLWLLTTPDPTLRAYGFYQYIGWQPTGQLINGEEKFIFEPAS